MDDHLQQQQPANPSSGIQDLAGNPIDGYNDPAQLEGMEIKDSPFRLTGHHSIAAGSFGQVYLTKNKDTKEFCAAKLVRKDNPNAKLKCEYEWYKILESYPGLPRVLHFGECGPYDVMVMELLGPNLERVFNKNKSKFTVRTTTQIALQILEIMRFIHSKKIIFCNVKPENFCLGPPNTRQANQVFMIGLINARWFETEDSRHIPKKTTENVEKKRFGVYGTPRYMSLNAHKGKEISRRDDLESLGYMLLYFLYGKLPWQGLINGNCENIYQIKKRIHLDELCANLPPEYYHYMLYVRTLKFAQEPNYRYLITMFTKLLNRINMESRLVNTMDIFDWNIEGIFPTAESVQNDSTTTNTMAINSNSNSNSNSNNDGNLDSGGGGNIVAGRGLSSPPPPPPPSPLQTSSPANSLTHQHHHHSSISSITSSSSSSFNSSSVKRKQVSFKISLQDGDNGGDQKNP